MGRSVPYDNANNSLKGSFLYFSFSFLALATSIAIITTLCSVGFRRKKSTSPPPQPHTSSNPFVVTPTSNANEEAASTTTSANATIFMSQEQPRTSVASKLENTTIEENNNEMLLKELPLPPAMQVMQQSNNNINTKLVNRTTSERKLKFNLSMKMPRSLSLARNWDKKEDKYKNLEIGKKEKLKADEGVWMKAIILGEKCVPDEEEDAVIYEGKGKKISAYHPRSSVSSTTNNKSLSRQWSSVALDVPQSHEERMNNI
ncbi:hypothetical protein L195_g012320 [Trifolium pratense]|uniref:Transmembrane protein n=1 Tax=Trifolium pratense TaxID=57577 RepID=A0A2K3PJZ6_TRIPR|nr:hypothetical protein L195_g012320 [Trifolium pratense]